VPPAIVLSADVAGSGNGRTADAPDRRFRHDRDSMSSVLLPPVPARVPFAVPVVLRWLAAPLVGGVLGIGLGCWCRREAGGDGLAGMLADLGAPWILAAFVAGAVTMVAADRRWAAQPGAAVAGALAGSTCLVVATLVYYGPAQTGELALPTARGVTLVWAFVGIGVGVVMGAAGALWRSAPTLTQAAACLVAAGTAIAAEAYYLLDAGAYLDERPVLVALAAFGIAMPLLLGPRLAAPIGAVLVAVLAVPGSLVAETVWRGSVESIAFLARR
jgi:Family of unknown function (DUF6518)